MAPSKVANPVVHAARTGVDTRSVAVGLTTGHLQRQECSHRRQVACQRVPTIAVVVAFENLPTRRRKELSAACDKSCDHRCEALRQPVCERLPVPALVVAAVDAGVGAPGPGRRRPSSGRREQPIPGGDRKSTRLNSSH